MRVLACGGRDYADVARVHAVLASHAVTELAEGGHRNLLPDGNVDWSRSADAIARKWADDVGIPARTFEAHWRELGRAAGPLRNARMLADFQPDAVVAFPGGRGTADMVRRARAAGVPVYEVQP